MNKITKYKPFWSQDPPIYVQTLGFCILTRIFKVSGFALHFDSHFHYFLFLFLGSSLFRILSTCLAFSIPNPYTRFTPHLLTFDRYRIHTLTTHPKPTSSSPLPPPAIPSPHPTFHANPLLCVCVCVCSIDPSIHLSLPFAQHWK